MSSISVRATRPGKLVPPAARRLKSRAIRLRTGQAVDWHTTGVREELIIVLAGAVRLEVRASVRRLRTTSVSAGWCAFVPHRVWHRVVNRSARPAHYVYVTA